MFQSLGSSGSSRALMGRTVCLITGLALAAGLLASCGRAPVSVRALSTAVRAAGTPNEFMWGVSTAGYQWEGHDKSSQWAIWDQQGRTAERNTHAANGLELYPEDVRLTRGMGCNAMRTSIEWSRIEPTKGVYDPKAIKHYHDVLDEMRKNGLEPIMTLMHFTYPAWLDREGGWEDGRTPAKFAKFAAFVAKEYGAKIRYYITFNEPNTYLIAGWLARVMPPGKADPLAGLAAMRNMLKAHDMAYDAVHASDPESQVSFNMYTAEWPWANTRDELNHNESPSPGSESARDKVYKQLATVDTGDGKSAKLDYAALDYYCRFRTVPVPFPSPDRWEVYPEGLYNAIKRNYARYRLPILIAENGLATRDNQPRADRWTRSAYLVAHIRQMQRAMSEGYPVMGYIHWSITDNYEWGSFSPRFGLYTVDCRNRDFTRVQADGVDAFRAIIATGGVSQALLRQYPSPQTLPLPAPWVGGGTGSPVGINDN